MPVLLPSRRALAASLPLLFATLAPLACGSSDGGSGSPPAPTPPPYTAVSLTAVDKVDLLLVVDDSAGMADEQAIVADAAPALVSTLVAPSCVDDAGRPTGDDADPSRGREANWGCPPSTQPAFPPVVDMHVGVVSTSLGGMGGDVCADDGPTNGAAHLRTTAKGGRPVRTATSGFLRWVAPSSRGGDPPAGAIDRPEGLATSIADLVTGVGASGCAYAAQLETVYRFLSQPDPWTRVTIDGASHATLGDDVDWRLLAQRADFLRPDSLVVVVLVTAKEDASLDPRSADGLGWAYAARRFPGSTVVRADGATTTAPRATSACATDPASADCASCLVAGPGAPGCEANGGFYRPDEDALAVRFFGMKRRFGVDPRYPLARYVDGLTKATAPDRAAEHARGAYAHAPACTNPLFAASLPRAPGDETCALPVGTRGADHVVVTVVGGVPAKLLRDGEPDWTAILGSDPDALDEDGIDPHMIESTTPRPGLPPPSATRGDVGPDPVHGREWDTRGEDLQYACTFALSEPRACSASDPSCDCAGAARPPLCGSTPGVQTRAKAYPSRRPLQLAKALGARAAVASACPATLADRSSPDYGYVPALRGLADRVARGLGPRCADAERDAGGALPCTVLARVDDASECARYGLQAANDAQLGVLGANGPACVVPQVSTPPGASCKDDTAIGWCAVETPSCAATIHVTAGAGQLRDATLYCPPR